MAIQAHVHQMAVAAGDVYVRVYDRRMLSTGNSLTVQCVALVRLLHMAPCSKHIWSEVHVAQIRLSQSAHCWISSCSQCITYYYDAVAIARQQAPSAMLAVSSCLNREKGHVCQ